MPRIKMIGRTIKKRRPNGWWVKPTFQDDIFISDKLITNCVYSPPVTGVDQYLEMDLPEWFIEKKQTLKKYLV